MNIFMLDIWEYLTNNIKFIRNDFEEEDYQPRQNESSIVLIENVKKEDYPFNSGDWKKSKNIGDIIFRIICRFISLIQDAIKSP